MKTKAYIHHTGQKSARARDVVKIAYGWGDENPSQRQRRNRDLLATKRRAAHELIYGWSSESPTERQLARRELRRCRTIANRDAAGRVPDTEYNARKRLENRKRTGAFLTDEERTPEQQAAREKKRKHGRKPRRRPKRPPVGRELKLANLDGPEAKCEELAARFKRRKASIVYQRGTDAFDKRAKKERKRRRKMTPEQKGVLAGRNRARQKERFGYGIPAELLTTEQIANRTKRNAAIAKRSKK